MIPRPDTRPSPLPASSSSVKEIDLPRMKLIAFALFVGAALLYAFGIGWAGRHPAAPWLAAFGEAAMVGAIADWFAVVALFRHPLGLPIPHTAIIPNNKDRIGSQLANFLCLHFLGTEQVLAKLVQFDAAARLAGWLATPRHASQAAAQLGGVLRYGLGALDDARVRHFVGGLVLAPARSRSTSRALAAGCSMCSPPIDATRRWSNSC